MSRCDRSSQMMYGRLALKACLLVIAIAISPVQAGQDRESLGDLPVRCFRHPSGSMSPTLNEGQVYFAYRTAVSSIRRGDIIAFRPNRTGQGFWFKRVVGLPGDKVAMLDGTVILNGRRVERRIVASDKSREGIVQFREQFPGEAQPHQIFDSLKPHSFKNLTEQIVPQDMFFVLGDNRSDSLDSRASDWTPTEGGGPVPFATIFGVVDMKSISAGPICRFELLREEARKWLN